MKWSNKDGAAARRVPMICGLLVGMLALGWGSWAQAKTPGAIGGPYVGPSAPAGLGDLGYFTSVESCVLTEPKPFSA